MSVTYVIEFSVKEAQRQRFLHLLTGVLDAMREEPMFITATLNADPNDQNHFLLHETWESHEDVMSVQITRPYRDEWHAALPDLLVGERKISVWQPLQHDCRRDGHHVRMP
ncbi:Quinol monooxygenase YgiN [Rhizobium sp. NFR07]|uniref:putative quinol monooxygenase n=1 Tax=Rhizobium sp. NFR07 TaxID=1566262 RepID=UPI0008ECD509|nr:putative quinol monooxygenase [Rhizobium sp. NFR07]SFB48802.1 Quinol monooxygenase YgiN [Rhizobium sp. NFR07]